METDGVVVGLRAVKDRYEIARMRGAQSITDAAFEHIVRYMRPGMMERQVQLELEEFMLRHGAQGLAFPSIVATGPNGAEPARHPRHHHAGGRPSASCSTSAPAPTATART